MNRTTVAGVAPALDPQMKIYEMIDCAPSLLSIFSRLDIKLPFGDISVAQMCRRDGRSVELFMMLCRLHIDLSYCPPREQLQREMLAEVIDYLRASHRYYTEYMLPHIARHLDEVLLQSDKLSYKVLHNFYDEYMRDVLAHFEEEEHTIFSAVEASVQGDICDMAMFEAPHSDIDDRTNDIASLIIKSLPEEVPTSLRCSMLDDIYALRDDLRRHSVVEMSLLRPLVEKFLKQK